MISSFFVYLRSKGSGEKEFSSLIVAMISKSPFTLILSTTMYLA